MHNYITPYEFHPLTQTLPEEATNYISQVFANNNYMIPLTDLLDTKALSFDNKIESVVNSQLMSDLEARTFAFELAYITFTKYKAAKPELYKILIEYWPTKPDKNRETKNVLFRNDLSPLFEYLPKSQTNRTFMLALTCLTMRNPISALKGVISAIRVLDQKNEQSVITFLGERIMTKRKKVKSMKIEFTRQGYYVEVHYVDSAKFGIYPLLFTPERQHMDYIMDLASQRYNITNQTKVEFI